MTKTVSSTENPALLQTLVQKAFEQQDTPQYKAAITPPSDTFVELPCGYITPAGEILKSAEVRELTGRDEEAIAKIDSLGKALNVMLSRGVVKIGNLEATEEVLDNLLAGDRDMLLLAIYRATFGDSAKVNVWCSNCSTSHLVSIEVPGDIKITTLSDPVNDRFFTIKGKTNTYTCTLPNGKAQKELFANPDKSSAELSTILLEKCVLEINERPLLSKNQVQDLGIKDRQKISEEINKRMAGPQFDDLTVNCTDCGQEVMVPINLGTLFR